MVEATSNKGDASATQIDTPTPVPKEKTEEDVQAEIKKGMEAYYKD